MATAKIISGVTHGSTSEFQSSVCLQESQLAYSILETVLEEGFYPENAIDEWTDICVLDGKFYAVFGDDNFTAHHGSTQYVEIQPTKKLKEAYEYFKQYA